MLLKVSTMTLNLLFIIGTPLLIAGVVVFLALTDHLGEDEPEVEPTGIEKLLWMIVIFTGIDSLLRDWFNKNK